MSDGLLSNPRVYGSMYESNNYSNMGIGLTSRVLLVGHADGLTINDPYQVASLKEAIVLMGKDVSSPLLRSLLEAYYAGCRDLWIMAAAPMSEYVADLDDRLDDGEDELNYYERYYNRLEDSYRTIASYDFPQIIIPVEAPHYYNGYAENPVDFTTQLADFCYVNYVMTGSLTIGLIGTSFSELADNQVAEMLIDPRLTQLGEATADDPTAGRGKFVSVYVGSTVFSTPELPFSYSGSPVASIAGLLSNQRLDMGLTYQRIPNIVRLGYSTLSKESVSQLAEAKLNPIIYTQRGKRGRSGEVVCGTDNTLGKTGTDYWSIVQFRLVQYVIEDIATLGKRDLGTIGFEMFRADVEGYMGQLMTNNVIRGYSLDIRRVRDGQAFTETAEVNVSVRPYFGLREIQFTTTAGPGD